MNPDGPPVPPDDEWPQEPDGFHNIKFGSTKEDAEKFVTFEEYVVSEDWLGPDLDTPYPTRGVTHFSFGGIEITVSLIFTLADGCHCFDGIFPTEHFDSIKSAFLNLYGQPHEVSFEVRQFSEVDWKTIPFSTRQHETNVESLKWCSERVYIFLVNEEQYSKGYFLVAKYSYMKHRSGGEKMAEKLRRKLVCTQDVYEPPGGWTQEPDNFAGLKLGMTKAEAERHVTFGKCTVTTQDIPGFPTRENYLYETTFKVGGLSTPGEVLFIKDRLVNLGGEFDKSLWDVVRPAFIDFYGRPHSDERREIFEQGLSRRLEWQGDRVQIGLLDFPDGTTLSRFWFQHTLKGQQLEIRFVPTSTSVPTATPPPQRPRIVVEHTPSMLVLRLPDGTTLDYPRGDPPQVALKATWHRGDDGRFVYDLELDASMLVRIGIGEGGGCIDRNAVASQPEGWTWMWSGWEAWIGEGGVSSSDETARFSIASDLLPGPIPTYLVRKDAKQAVPGQWGRHRVCSVTHPPWPIPFTLPRRLYHAVLETLDEQTDFLNNALIIGPAIKPNSTEENLRQLAQEWIDRYGFDFLKPALDGKAGLSTELEQLRPNTDFERQIVDCLRAAI
jgi:hypothetical protein